MQQDEQKKGWKCLLCSFKLLVHLKKYKKKMGETSRGNKSINMSKYSNSNPSMLHPYRQSGLPGCLQWFILCTSTMILIWTPHSDGNCEWKITQTVSNKMKCHWWWVNGIKGEFSLHFPFMCVFRRHLRKKYKHSIPHKLVLGLSVACGRRGECYAVQWKNRASELFM